MYVIVPIHICIYYNAFSSHKLYPIKQTHYYLSRSCYGKHDTISPPLQEESVFVMVWQTYNVASPTQKRIQSALHSLNGNDDVGYNTESHSIHSIHTSSIHHLKLSRKFEVEKKRSASCSMQKWQHNLCKFVTRSFNTFTTLGSNFLANNHG
jgi:hypothetical protein